MPQLEKLTVLPSVRNRIFPQLLELAGKEMPLEELAAKLAAIIYDYSLSKPEAMRLNIVRQRISELPAYLSILIPNNDDIAGLLNDGTLHLLSSELLTPSEARTADDTGGLKTGAPRGIKKILAIPDEQRTEKQQRDLDSWARRFGKQITGSRHQEKQPGQRQLAELQAERERQRGVV